MRLCILENDHPPTAFEASHGRFADLFRRWLGPALPEAEFAAVDVWGGAALPDAEAFDGFILTGSRAGAYDDYGWIAPLTGLLQEIRAARRPVAGVCFGHQIMAQAYGGAVRKAAVGWTIGRHSHDFTPEGAARFGAAPAELLSFHQDQVVALPPGARVLVSSEASPNGALAYDFPALSTQFHPEFTDAHVLDTLAALPELAPGIAAQARAGLGPATEGARIARGFAAFFREHAGAAQAAGATAQA